MRQEDIILLILNVTFSNSATSNQAHFSKIHFFFTVKNIILENTLQQIKQIIQRHEFIFQIHCLTFFSDNF